MSWAALTDDSKARQPLSSGPEPCRTWGRPRSGRALQPGPAESWPGMLCREASPCLQSFSQRWRGTPHAAQGGGLGTEYRVPTLSELQAQQLSRQFPPASPTGHRGVECTRARPRTLRHSPVPDFPGLARSLVMRSHIGRGQGRHWSCAGHVNPADSGPARQVLPDVGSTRSLVPSVRP